MLNSTKMEIRKNVEIILYALENHIDSHSGPVSFEQIENYIEFAARAIAVGLHQIGQKTVACADVVNLLNERQETLTGVNLATMLDKNTMYALNVKDLAYAFVNKVTA